MMIDVGANVVLAFVDALALVAVWKRPKPAVLASVFAAGGIASLILSFGLGGGGIFGMMRVLAWAIFLHGMVVLAGGAILLWRPHRKFAIGAGAAAVLIALVGLDAFFLEPHNLEVTRLRISSPKLTRPLKIVIIADLQTDEVGEYERSVLRSAKDEKPDLVLFAGDYIQEHDPGRRRELNRDLRAILKELEFKSAIAVEGNCDADDWPDIFEGTGIQWTRETRAFREGDIQVTALSLDDSEYLPSVKSSDQFHIVMGHIPNFARGDVQADLLVAGHTHGGQVRLPFIGPLITLSRVPRAWAAGVTALEGGRTLVVSRGIGMERGRAPRLRFLCRPELVIIDAVPGR